MSDWRAIINEHRDTVWHTVYRLLGDYTDAADCLQETFVCALEISRREPIRNWAALLRRLATTRALDRLRQRIRQNGYQESISDFSPLTSSTPDPSQNAETSELCSHLRRGLAELQPEQAQAFCLRFLEDMSYRQIARQMGIKTGKVGVLLYRARLHLREILTAVYVEE